MNFKSRLFSAIATTTILCSAWVAPALAQDAVLRATTPGAEINLRAGAGLNSEVIGSGIVGDRVRVLQEMRDRDGFVWYQVQFYNSGATGWIRGDFIRTVANNQSNSHSNAI